MVQYGAVAIYEPYVINAYYKFAIAIYEYIARKCRLKRVEKIFCRACTQPFLMYYFNANTGMMYRIHNKVLARSHF